MFYVYLHCKPDGSPFYVGKGSGKRSSDFRNGRNRHYKFVVQKYGRQNIGIVKIPCASEAEAFSMEIALIEHFKKIGFPLTNQSDGGEGASGVIRTEDTRRKIALSKYGNTHTLGLRRGPMSSEQRAKLSATRLRMRFKAWNKGVLRTEEEKAKMSAARRAGIAKRALCQ